MLQPPWKTVWRFLRKPKIELPYDPAIPLLGIYLKKKKARKTNLKIYLHHNVHTSIFIFAKIWNPRYGF